LHPQWQLSTFEVDSTAIGAATNGSVPSVSFNIVLATDNFGYGTALSVYQGASVASGSSWYGCALGPGGETITSSWPYECSFMYDPTTKALALKANLMCNDLDPDHP